MEKWADYLISAVQYDPEHLHITKVQIREDMGDKVGRGSESSRREEVIANIKSKKTYITVYRGQGNKWEKGEAVRIIVVDGTEYIRTDRNQKRSDNLGDIPEF